MDDFSGRVFLVLFAFFLRFAGFLHGKMVWVASLLVVSSGSSVFRGFRNFIFSQRVLSAPLYPFLCFENDVHRFDHFVFEANECVADHLAMSVSFHFWGSLSSESLSAAFSCVGLGIWV